MKTHFISILKKLTKMLCKLIKFTLNLMIIGFITYSLKEHLDNDALCL